MSEAELNWPPGKKPTPVNHLHGKLGLTIETIIVTICLSLSLASYPHHLRSSLWAAGAEHGWNSDPHERVYFYANYKTPPPVPFIWSEGVEQSNVAVAVVGVVVCVSRWSLIWCRYRLGCIELLYDILLSFLWYASLSGQTASDLSDLDHLSTRPWYLRKECGAVKPPATNACALMQAQCAMSIFMFLFYASRSFAWTLYIAYCYGASNGRGGGVNIAMAALMVPSDPLADDESRCAQQARWAGKNCELPFCD